MDYSLNKYVLVYVGISRLYNISMGFDDFYESLNLRGKD